MTDLAAALPLDAHLHTDLSPDADVPIDAYGAAARERGIAEVAITDHLDFDPEGPAYDYADYGRRLRHVRAAAERWEGRPTIRFGIEMTYQRQYEAAIRTHLAGHRYDYVVGSVHIAKRDPLRSGATAAAWCAGKSQGEASAPYFAEVEAAIRSGLFDTIGHLDFVKRYTVAHLGPLRYEDHADLYDRLLVALVESGMALEVNSSGLRQTAREPYPAPVVVERFRALGGARVVAGSDAHQIGSFAFGLEEAYRSIAAAGFRSLSFRRGRDRVEVPLETDLVAALAGR